MPTGFITSYSQKKGFGFLDCPELDLTHIYFHKSNCESSFKEPKEHDLVEFELTRSIEQSFEYEAIVVHYLRNQQFDQLKNLHESGTKLFGFLKCVDEEYFVKDQISKMRIKLTVSPFEINLGLNYDRKIETLVEYEIIGFGADKWIHANLKDRQFSADFNLAMSGKVLQGYVVKKVGESYKVKILNSISGIVPFAYAMGRNFAINEPVELVSTGLCKYGGTVFFKFADYEEPVLTQSMHKPTVHRSLYEEIGHVFHRILNKAVAMMF